MINAILATLGVSRPILERIEEELKDDHKKKMEMAIKSQSIGGTSLTSSRTSTAGRRKKS